MVFPSKISFVPAYRVFNRTYAQPRGWGAPAASRLGAAGRASIGATVVRSRPVFEGRVNVLMATHPLTTAAMASR